MDVEVRQVISGRSGSGVYTGVYTAPGAVSLVQRHPPTAGNGACWWRNPFGAPGLKALYNSAAGILCASDPDGGNEQPVQPHAPKGASRFAANVDGYWAASLADRAGTGLYTSWGYTAPQYWLVGLGTRRLFVSRLGVGLLALDFTGTIVWEIPDIGVIDFHTLDDDRVVYTLADRVLYPRGYAPTLFTGFAGVIEPYVFTAGGRIGVAYGTMEGGCVVSWADDAGHGTLAVRPGTSAFGTVVTPGDDAAHVLVWTSPNPGETAVRVDVIDLAAPMPVWPPAPVTPPPPAPTIAPFARPLAYGGFFCTSNPDKYGSGVYPGNAEILVNDGAPVSFALCQDKHHAIIADDDSMNSVPPSQRLSLWCAADPGRGRSLVQQIARLRPNAIHYGVGLCAYDDHPDGRYYDPAALSTLVDGDTVMFPCYLNGGESLAGFERSCTMLVQLLAKYFPVNLVLGYSDRNGMLTESQLVAVQPVYEALLRLDGVIGGWYFAARRPQGLVSHPVLVPYVRAFATAIGARPPVWPHPRPSPSIHEGAWFMNGPTAYYYGKKDLGGSRYALYSRPDQSHIFSLQPDGTLQERDPSQQQIGIYEAFKFDGAIGTVNNGSGRYNSCLCIDVGGL